MSNHDHSKEIIMSLKGTGPDNIYAIEYSLDEGIPDDLSFTYCLCCYIQFIEDRKVVKISSVESETGYTIYIRFVPDKELDEALSEFGEYMARHDILLKNNSEIYKVEINSDGDDIVALSLYFSSGRQLHVVNGDVFLNAGGDVEVSSCDEMLLIFDRKVDAEKYGFL